MNTPFLGAFYEHTMVFNGVVPAGPDASWDLRNQGVKLGDQLLEVNGQTVNSTFEVQSILSGFHPGDQIPVIVRSPDGSEITYHVTLSVIPNWGSNNILVIPILLSLLFLIISLWIFRNTPRNLPAACLHCSPPPKHRRGSLFDLLPLIGLTYIWTLA